MLLLLRVCLCFQDALTVPICKGSHSECCYVHFVLMCLYLYMCPCPACPLLFLPPFVFYPAPPFLSLLPLLTESVNCLRKLQPSQEECHEPGQPTRPIVCANHGIDVALFTNSIHNSDICSPTPSITLRTCRHWNLMGT